MFREEKNRDEILEFILKKWDNIEEKFGYVIVFPKLIHSVRWKYYYDYYDI